jgi:hypothetical protein
MKRIVNLVFSTVCLIGLTGLLGQAQTSSAQDQSLGDYARAVKKDKKAPTKSFDNDNLPMQDSLSVVGNNAPQTTDAAQETSSDAAIATHVEGDNIVTGNAPAAGKRAPKVEEPKITPGESAEDRQKVFDKWQDKLDTQQQKVDMLNRELDVMQREQKLKAAEFYSDAGARLRDSANWDKQQKDYQDQLQSKQKALTDAKQDMTDMQEDARKSGVPSSVTDRDQTQKSQTN